MENWQSLLLLKLENDYNPITGYIKSMRKVRYSSQFKYFIKLSKISYLDAIPAVSISGRSPFLNHSASLLCDPLREP